MEEIEEQLKKIETKLDNTISQLQGSNYSQDIKYKKMMEQWLGVLYNQFKKDLKKTKQEIIKEIKNGTKR